jgi:hypothetical protein
MDMRIDSGAAPPCAVSRYITRKGYDINERPCAKRDSILFPPVTRSFFENPKRFIISAITPKGVTLTKIIVFGINRLGFEENQSYYL